jgi:hypothetical protein
LSEPYRCADRDCTFVDAAPDPADATGLYAICRPASGPERVVWRSAEDPTCEPVFESAFPYRARLSALTVSR